MRSPLAINKCTQSLVNVWVWVDDALQQCTKLEKATKRFLEQKKNKKWTKCVQMEGTLDCCYSAEEHILQILQKVKTLINVTRLKRSIKIVLMERQLSKNYSSVENKTKHREYQMCAKDLSGKCWWAKMWSFWWECMHHVWGERAMWTMWSVVEGSSWLGVKCIVVSKEKFP